MAKNNSLKSTFNSVKNKIIKTPANKSIDKVDDILRKVSGDITDKNSRNQAELLRKVFSDTIDTSMFENIPTNIAFSTEFVTRINRYVNSEEICDSIPYCARALKVLSNEIVSPDNVTKEKLQFIQTKSFSPEDSKNLVNVRSINDMLKIEDTLHDLVYETLKFGDQFIEICNYSSEDVPLTQSILNEDYTPEYEIKYKVPKVSPQNKVILEDKIVNIKAIIEEAKDKEDQVDLSKIRLIIHDPSYVIKIQSRRFKLCLGYLVLPRPSNPLDPLQPSTGANAANQSRLRNILNFSTQSQDFLGVDRLYKDIISQIKKHVGNSDISVNKKETMAMITRIIKEIDDESEGVLKIRYVPPERMQHITIYNRRFFPYGESIFYKTTFAAKLLIAFQVALVIKRIGDSSDKRAIYVETGIPRNTRNLIEQIKEGLQKKKFSLGTVGSIGSIPSMITSYETYFIPQSHGKRFVEFDTVPAPVSIRDLHEELKFFRDELVSSLEVPPPYLNLEENLSNKNALSFENQMFARTVVSYQSMLSPYIQGLFSKIYKMVYGRHLPIGLIITFMPPKMLEIEREAEHMETVSRLITALSELGINREYLKRKYLSIDWEKLKEFETETSMDKKVEGGKEEGESEFGGRF
jgi:hypothetical protein